MLVWSGYLKHVKGNLKRLHVSMRLLKNSSQDIVGVSFVTHLVPQRLKLILTSQIPEHKTSLAHVNCTN